MSISLSMSPGRERWLLGGLTGAVVLSRWLLRAEVPDDYDSFGFVLGMGRKYDLGLFQPQFPGYPVYVALGAGFCRLGVPALAAAAAISSVASGVSGAGLAICARRLAGTGAAVAVLALHLVAWLPWLLGGGAWSEPLGMALAVMAFALLALPVPWPGASGFCAGLLLGVRASYWPLVLSLLVLALMQRAPQPEDRRRRPWRVLIGAAVGVVVWAVPFLAFVGPRRLFELGTTHLAGHFGQWGGTVATRPDVLERARACLRGLFFDGVAPSWPALAGIVIVVAVVVAVTALWAHRRRRTRGLIPGARFAAGTILVVLAPYALWAFLAQNVTEQPRHLLPLVEGELLLLGCYLAPHRLAVAGVCLLIAAVSAPLALERHRVPPAAAQAAAWVARNEPPARTLIAAGRSSRFFETLGETPVRQHLLLADLIVDLGRLARWPEVILVTSEIDLHSGAGPTSPLPRYWHVRPGPTFCRDPRIDRAQPCLSLSQLVWSAQ